MMTPSAWSLDPQLERDTVPIGDLTLCAYPGHQRRHLPVAASWCRAVPAAVELIDLDDERAGAADGRDRHAVARAQGRHRLRQAQRRGDRQRRGAAARPCRRPPAGRSRLAEARCGARRRPPPTTRPELDRFIDSIRRRSLHSVEAPQLPIPSPACASVRAPSPERISRAMSSPSISAPSRASAIRESRIDRAAERRNDAAALAAMEADPRAGVYVVGGEMIVLKKRDGGARSAVHAGGGARAVADRARPCFSGSMTTRRRFALAHRPGGDRSAQGARRPRGHRSALDRGAGTGRCASPAAARRGQGAAPLARAPSLLLELRRRRPNVSCGGWRRDCPACKAQHFPRTDPVVIMLPVDGDRCLLGRSPPLSRRACGRASQASSSRARRSRTRCAARPWRKPASSAAGSLISPSQPWPFPTSLMIGCHAEALTHDIIIDRTELEDARWFDREEVAPDAAAQRIRRD